jgi:hypothetical protein
VEVDNLGQPGSNPFDFANLAEKAIPVLLPDLVVVSILQTDDLLQLETIPSDEKPVVAVRPWYKQVPLFFAGNLRGWFQNHLLNTRKRSEIQNTWKLSAQNLVLGMSAESRSRFENLEPQVRDAFENGRLNPGLLYQLLLNPDYFVKTWNLESPNTERLIQVLARQLKRIRDVGERFQSRVLVLSMPLSVYVDPKGYNNRRQMGFEVRPDFLKGDAPDRAIARAADRAGVSFSTPTELFRKESIKRTLFFLYDGHLTPEGNQLYSDFAASLVAPNLSSAVASRER